MNHSPSGATNKSPFWVGIHEIYPNNVWGYQTDGQEVLRPFLVKEGTDQYSSNCAAMDDLKLVKKSCKFHLTFACEIGIVFLINNGIILHLKYEFIYVKFCLYIIWYISDGIDSTNPKQPGK